MKLARATTTQSSGRWQRVTAAAPTTTIAINREERRCWLKVEPWSRCRRRRLAITSSIQAAPCATDADAVVSMSTTNTPSRRWATASAMSLHRLVGVALLVVASSPPRRSPSRTLWAMIASSPAVPASFPPFLSLTQCVSLALSLDQMEQELSHRCSFPIDPSTATSRWLPF